MGGTSTQPAWTELGWLGCGRVDCDLPVYLLLASLYPRSHKSPEALEELAEGSLESVCPFPCQLHPNANILFLSLES